jgi:uncharacterized protein YegJ (DUF2314 family)
VTKEEAIAWYKEITGGAGVDRHSVLNVLRRGRIAEKMWDTDSTFSYGVEYGVLIALIKAFDLTNEDLGQ